MNCIKDDILNKYYNIKEFQESNELFEKYLTKCQIEKNYNNDQKDFQISTITSIINIGKLFNLKVLFENIEYNPDIVYMEYQNQIKGIKKMKNKKKKNNSNDKRKRNKGKTFANQLSIGFSCKEHNHKKPICVKMFRKGNLTITGTKSYKEIENICFKIINIIKNINTKYKYEEEEIIIYPYEELIEFKDLNINVETINGSYKNNFQINLNDFKYKIREFYNKEQIYIKSNRSALIELDLNIYKFFDKRKNKLKTPKISVYGTGSIVINSMNEELLYKSYDFIKQFFDEHCESIIDKDYIFNL
jgi:TATA-box binding protein (TBP) (component of TFIID and TFIIIB)